MFGAAGAVGGMLLLIGAPTIGFKPAPAIAHAAVPLPAPAAGAKEGGTVAVAVLAGGCFWGMEAVFEHVSGVRSVQSGYAGGAAADARYDRVGAGRTNHAEAVRIVYDPSKVSYATLLHIFFSVAHDPTQLNRQGPDVGRHYRSAIFPQNAGQKRAAEAYMTQLYRSGAFKARIATRVETGRFHPAEAYHQDFMKKNPRHSYILAHDVPKVRNLRVTFPRLFSARPSA